MLLDDQALATLRGQVVDIISGTVFVFLGLIACGIAAMRRRSGVRVLLKPVRQTRQRSQRTAHVTLVVAARAWLELSVGKLRLVVRHSAVSAYESLD